MTEEQAKAKASGKTIDMLSKETGWDWTRKGQGKGKGKAKPKAGPPPPKKGTSYGGRREQEDEDGPWSAEPLPTPTYIDGHLLYPDSSLPPEPVP